jgi:putative exporter of polyketide antibiotics
VLLLAISPTATAAQYQKLYPDEQSLQLVSSVVSNASLVALNGPLFGSTSAASPRGRSASPSSS